MDDLLREFIAETRETLAALSGEIVAWEVNPTDRARLDSIFRFVHTVKGSCGFLDLPRLLRLSHAAEDVLAQVRSGDRAPDPGFVNAVLAIVDRIGEIVEAIDAGASLDDSGEDLLIAALEEGAESAVAPTVAPVAQRAPARSVRLSVELLDRMMSGMSDMVLARNELSRRLRDSDADPAIENALERLSSTVAEMRETVTRTRMQNLDALFSALPRMVRDTAAGLGKAVTLTVAGSDVELDREMIEVMRDPLVHMIRNAIDHGIETPGARRMAGKRETGRIAVSARQSGNQIVIEIIDDGCGIDVERVIAKLAANTGRDPRDLHALPDAHKLALIFEPGLTTKDVVTEVSGRGVGMDVVRASIDQIGGRIELDNHPGHGLRIAIHVPLTLSIIPTIGVGVGDYRFAVPRLAIEEIISGRGEAIRIDRLGNTTVATLRGRRLLVVDLAMLMQLRDGEQGMPAMLVIVSVGSGSYALAVDTILDSEELVIKPAAPAVMATGIYAGQTLPDSGLPMLVLDCAGIASVAGLRFAATVHVEADPVAANDDNATDVLLFIDLDGARRAIPLAVIERIESADVDAVRMIGGRLRLVAGSSAIPLVAHGTMPPHGRITVLRLHDGTSDIGYAVAATLDIASASGEMTPAVGDGPVAGMIIADGDPVELVDPYRLFEVTADRVVARRELLCLIRGERAGWLASFLRPMLEGAGYHVTSELAPGEHADVVLMLDGEPCDDGVDAPVVRLRNAVEPDSHGDSIYRYDRDGLLSAIAARVSRGGMA